MNEHITTNAAALSRLPYRELARAKAALHKAARDGKLKTRPAAALKAHSFTPAQIALNTRQQEPIRAAIADLPEDLKYLAVIDLERRVKEHLNLSGETYAEIDSYLKDTLPIAQEVLTKWILITLMPELLRAPTIARITKMLDDMKAQRKRENPNNYLQYAAVDFEKCTQWLTKFHEKLSNLNCYSIMFCSGIDLESLADRLAKDTKALIHDDAEKFNKTYEETLKYIATEPVLFRACPTKLIYSKIRYSKDPLVTERRLESRRITIERAIGQLQNPAWWRKYLRTQTMRARELVAYHLGIVKDGKQEYCSNLSLNQYREHLKNMEEFQRSTKIQNGGTVLTIADIARTPYHRFAEMYGQFKGIEKLALMRAWTWTFIVITCPPEYHPNPSHGASKWDGELTARDGHDYINTGWASIRRDLGKIGIKAGEDYFGTWGSEPHKDGTPHRNVLLFHPPELQEIIENAFIREYGDKPAVEFRRNDGRASAATYIMKYIAKAVGLLGGGDNETTQRNCAWRATYGCRAFQFFGVKNCIGKWRELRKLRQRPADHNLYAAWHCATTNQFSSFISLATEIEYIKEDSFDRYGLPSKRITGLIHKISGATIHKRIWNRVDLKSLRRMEDEKEKKVIAVIGTVSCNYPRDSSLGGFSTVNTAEPPPPLN